MAGLGTGWLMLQSVSRDPTSFGSQWKKAYVTTIGSGLVLAIGFWLLARFWLGAEAAHSVLPAIAISELVLYPFILACGFAFQSHERLGWSNALPALLTSLRLAGALGFYQWSEVHTLERFVFWHVGSSLIAAILSWLLVTLLLKPARAAYSFGRHDIRDGLSFSSLWVSGNTVTELDKSLALRLAGSEVAGIYTSAYRLASALTLPFASLILAAQPRLFRMGVTHPAASSRLVKHLVLAAIANAVPAALVLYFCAGLLPLLLGPAFAGSEHAAKLLAPWPLLYSLRLLASSVLMTHGRRLPRMLCEMAAIALMITLSALLMPAYGLPGVVATVLVVESTLAASLWLLVLRLRRSGE